MKRILTTSMVLWAASCSSASDFSNSEDTRQTTLAANPSASKDAEQSPKTEEESEVSAVPTVVTGGYLSCSYTDALTNYEVSCSTEVNISSQDPAIEFLWDYVYVDQSVSFEVLSDPSSKSSAQYITPRDSISSLDDLRNKMMVVLKVTLNGQVIHEDMLTMDKASYLPPTFIAQTTGLPNIACAEHWVAVKGDIAYGTQDFCVMKFEAKNVNGVATSTWERTPWANVSQSDAKQACENLGTGYSLISNAQWMTIADQVASNTRNWSGNAVGSGVLNRGHMDADPNRALEASSNDLDPCFLTGDLDSCPSDTSWKAHRRTSYINGDAFIWDFTGNLSEWIVDTVDDKQITPSNGSFVEIKDLTFSGGFTAADVLPTRKPFYSADWDSGQGIGMYQGDNDGVALKRGGAFDSNGAAGIYAFGLSDQVESTLLNVGFRCVRQ